MESLVHLRVSQGLGLFGFQVTHQFSPAKELARRLATLISRVTGLCHSAQWGLEVGGQRIAVHWQGITKSEAKPGKRKKSIQGVAAYDTNTATVLGRASDWPR
jgi:hypothetical protein